MIFLTVCAFADHREVLFSTVESEINKALIEIIEADKEYVLYSGRVDDLDKKYESTAQEMKKKHPRRSTRLVRVLPYLTHEINRDREYFESYCDDIAVPMKLMGVHYKATIKKRDRWMVDQANKILVYIYRDFGSALSTIKYAYRMGKPVLNFTMKE